MADASIARITALLATLMLGAASCPRADADTPPVTAPRGEAALSESEAIQLAKDEATRLKVDLTHFDAPTATFISDGRRGKWHVFFVARWEQSDDCFFVDIYSDGQRPRLSWCS